MLIDKSVKEYIKQVQSEDPTPGGGSVAATVGALGGALINMVGNLTIDKKVYTDVPEDKKKVMEESFKGIEALVEDLLVIIDEDATAFDGVMNAFKLPKETEEDKKKRREAIQEGYKKALETPLRCAEKCLEILKLQEIFAEYGNVNAITDVGVGTLLAYSGLEGALFNVTINLKSIKDLDYKKEMEDNVNSIMDSGKELKEELLKVVYTRLA